MTTLTSPREPIKAIYDVLTQTMTNFGLSPANVVLAYQRYEIPTAGPLAVLTTVLTKLIGSSDVYPALGPNPDDGVFEQQTISVLETIQIDVLAFDDSARQLRFPIWMALNSYASQSEGEAYALQIPRQSGMWHDTSYLEAAGFLQRYTTQVKVSSVQTLPPPTPDYYNSFPLQNDIDGTESDIFYPEEPYGKQ
jgi:hypothetical protein